MTDKALEEILYKHCEDLTDVQHIKLRQAILSKYISREDVLGAIESLNRGDWSKPINSDELRQKLEVL